MKKKQQPSKSQSFGMPVVAGAVAVILITMVGLLSYLATSRFDAPAATVSRTESTTGDSAYWRRVDSMGATFSIQLPDGWWLDSYPNNVLNGDRIVYDKGTLAAVSSHSEGPYTGGQKKFNVVLSDKPVKAPQWQSPNPHGRESVVDFNAGDLKGKRYSIEWADSFVDGTYEHGQDDIASGSRVYRGDKIYQYVFDLPNGKQLSAVYLLPATDKDNLKTVEKTVKTLRVY